MKVVVGLGNPGDKYSLTRHNVGFMALDNFVNEDSFKKKDNYLYVEKVINNEKVLFVKPLTYMNDSGLAVRKVVDYYKVDLKDLIVIYDDMDYEVGTFKIKKTGSGGGHNGIKSVISHLNTMDINRIRIGISKNNNSMVDYVLGNFSKEDISKLKSVFDVVNNVIIDFTILDIEKLMSKYN